jgi:hypothetical protein
MTYEQEFNKFFSEHAKIFKAPEGYLVVDDTNNVLIKNEYDHTDTIRFMPLNYTCTAVVVMTLHKGQFGSIVWESDQLSFRPETMTPQTPPQFGGIYLTRDFKTFGFEDHDFSYSHHVIEINNIFLSWQDDHFMLDNNKPLRFK